MSFRGSASSFSALLSLGLIAAIVFAIVDRSRQRPNAAPAALSESQKSASIPRPARPKAAATQPVVLPPPPAPKPAPKTTVARRNPPAAPPKQAPRPAEIKEIKKQPPPVESPRPAKSERPPPARSEAPAPRPWKPEPAPETARKPVQRAISDQVDRPRRVARALAPAKRAAPQPKGEAVTASQEDVAEGRTLLRLLEFGSGPSIELAWPDAAAGREALFTTLDQCFGMQVALMDGGGRLFIAEGKPSTPWNLNLDRFSSFIREPAGQLSKQERRAVERIRAHHRDLSSGEPVRIFPRAVDARLLGGLRRLLGAGYAKARVIRARYRIDGRRLLVEQVVADGRKIQGRLEVPPISRGRCSRLART